MTHKYVVQNTRQVRDILLVTLVPKHGRSVMGFEAGQYAAISFTNGGRPTPMRCFSIVSNPGSKTLQFAMRVLGDFTQAAVHLRVGESVRVQGPFGHFIIDPAHDRQVVMLAAGIGITPFISMLRDISARRLPVRVTLLFANRSEMTIPFHEELQMLAVENPLLDIQYFCSDTTERLASSIASTRGGISLEHLSPLMSGQFADATYFICGPEGFTTNMRNILTRNDIDESRILDESFSQAGSPRFGVSFSIRTMTYGFTAASLVLLTGFIMILDLSRTVPRLVSAQVPLTSQTVSSTQSDDDSSGPDPAPTPSREASAPIQSNTSAPAPPTYRQTYQAPRSSVS